MRRQRWMHDISRPLAVGGMMGTIAVSVVDLVQLFFPDWNGTFVVVGSVLAALEATLSYRFARSRRIEGSEWIRFRLAEMALFLIFVRLSSYLGNPWREVVRDVRSWPQEPWRMLDLEIIGAMGLVLFSWSASTSTTHDLERIGEPPVKDKYYVPPLEALTKRFFRGGVLLLSVAGVTRVGIANLLAHRRLSVSGLILNVLVYFALGLLMLGQIQFSRQSERWVKEGLELPASLATRWLRYTVLLLALAGLIAWVLPTAYTVPLLDIASIIIQAVLYVVNLIFYIVVLAFLLLLTPLVRLLGGEIRSAPPVPAPGTLVPQPTPDGSAPAWFELLKSVTFWAFTLAIVLYVIRSYVRETSNLAPSISPLRAWHALRQRFRALVKALSRLVGVVRERLPRSIQVLQRRRKGVQPFGDAKPFRYFRLGALSRRERTIYYYLSTLRRAARRGFPRRRSQTPYEYQQVLGLSLSQVERELDRLTDAFVEARYSNHKVHADQAKQVRSDWRKIRAALQALRRETGRSDDARAVERQ